MKILFVARAGKASVFKTVVENQYNSLLNGDVLQMEAFSITGKGLSSYWNAWRPLRKAIRQFGPDVIHAHYSFSGILAYFSTRKIPVLVSLMGSDLESHKSWLFVIRFFARYFWKATIVKSQSLQSRLELENLYVLANGVDTARFKPLDKMESAKQIGWNPHYKNILFLADPSRREKNSELSKQSVALLNNEHIHLQIVSKANTEQVPFYLNAADVVVLSSLWEGSPNVIKEAMACNRPIVSTKVGDVEMLLENVKGAFLADFEAQDFANKITQALTFKESDGRNKIKLLKLESKQVVSRLKEIYLKYGA